MNHTGLTYTVSAICLLDQYFFFFLFLLYFLFLFVFLGPHTQHMEVPRLGVESELQLPACTTATATQDSSHICNLQHSSHQRPILNPLIKARDWNCILMDASWVRYHWATMETPSWTNTSWITNMYLSPTLKHPQEVPSPHQIELWKVFIKICCPLYQ